MVYYIYLIRIYHKPIEIFDDSKPDGQFRKPSDNSKIKSYLPNFKFTPLYDGLKETIEWFEKNFKLNILINGLASEGNATTQKNLRFLLLKPLFCHSFAISKYCFQFSFFVIQLFDKSTFISF